jgi:hypothetical protein
LSRRCKRIRRSFAGCCSRWLSRTCRLSWRKHFIGQPADDEIRRLLQAELARAFGEPADHFKAMTCSVIFKGITYELLNDEDFIKMAKKKIKSDIKLYDEFDAVKARD